MKSARLFFAAAILFQGGCDSGQKAAPAAAPAKKAAKPVDLTRFFPLANRGDVKLEEEHLLGKDYLPGGNIAHYKNGKQEYDLFLLKTSGNEAAALLVFEFKGKLKDAKLIPHFGGYYGLDGEKKIFLFPKLAYLAGVVGLTEKEADGIARDFAARIH